MTSCSIDLHYIKALVKFVRKDADVHCKLITDNSAARQIANKLGVCRVRHLQGKLLWIQQMVQRQEFTIHQAPTKFNPADMCTKNLELRRHCTLMFLHDIEYGDGETIYQDENRTHMTNRIVRGSRTQQGNAVQLICALLLNLVQGTEGNSFEVLRLGVHLCGWSFFRFLLVSLGLFGGGFLQ